MRKQQVVVAYDFSKDADVAMQSAIALACREPDQVLHFVTVIETGQDYLTAGELQEDLLQRLRLIFEVVGPGGEIEFYVHVRIGKAAAEILGVAEDVGADLILCGSHGRGALGRLLIGSVSEAVLHGARCPVLIGRAKGYPHVALQKVIEVAPEGFHRPQAHRYSYTSSQILTRPDAWPLG